MILLSRITEKPWLNRAAVTIFDLLIGVACVYALIHFRYAYGQRGIPSSVDVAAAVVFFISCVLTWTLMDVNRAIWRLTSLDDIKKLLLAVLFATITALIILFFFFDRAMDFSRSVLPILAPLFFVALVLCRIIFVFLCGLDIRGIFRAQNKALPDAILLGSEDSMGAYLRNAHQRREGPLYNVRGLLGTNESHKGKSIRGVPILGGVESVKDIFSDIGKQYYDPPTLISTDDKLDRRTLYRIIREASEIGAPLVRVDGSRPYGVCEFEVADLIGRKAKILDTTPVKRFAKGKRIMITGAGGTVGSEITRQVAMADPERLLLVENSEYNLYKVDHELKKIMPTPKHRMWFPYVADICDKSRMEEIFKREEPQIVLHAAAMKHVPLSECNPVQALRINLGGTRNILDLTIKYRARNFILISTDKAVCPSNIMGVSKRLAEMLIMARGNNLTDISICAVRFGNVLASTGSVVPLFEEQISDGGPVTVTDKNASRYFMTTGESASLVLQAAALNASERAGLSSIYALEMGEPVKIAELARQLVRLRGKIPDKDIDIVFTGLRPGEKRHEEIKGLKENFESTYVDGIQRFTEQIPNPGLVYERINMILKGLETGDMNSIQDLLQKLIPDYDPQHETLASPESRIPEREYPDARVVSLSEKMQPGAAN